MDRIDKLFLDTLTDLASRTKSAEEYTILGCAGLIRKLLFDARSLADQVNRKYRFRLEFEVTRPPKFSAFVPAPIFTSIQDGIDPDTAPEEWPREKITKDALFTYPLITVREHTYSLREIVQFEANVMGGVHAGLAREQKEKVLDDFASTFSIGGVRTSLRQLVGVGRVVLKGLSPLREAVVNASIT